MIDFIVDPWLSGAWMWRTIVTGLLVSVACSMVGVFLYLRGMSMIADALAHVALPGIVFAFFLTGGLAPGALLVGATVVSVAAAGAIEALSAGAGLRRDAAIGTVFTVAFSIGVILLSLFVHDAHIDLDCVLFGNILGVSDTTLRVLSIVAPVVVVSVVVFYRWLAVSTFDPSIARNLGVPVVAVHYGLMTATSVVAVASFEAVGAVLGVAMVIVPAATAHVLVDRLPMMLVAAVAHAVLSTLLGVYFSIAIDCSTAGAIVVVGGGLYLLAFLAAPRHGIVTARLMRWVRRGRPRATHPVS